MKKIIKLTEQDLHDIIKGSVNKMLVKEEYNRLGVWDLLNELIDVLGAETVLERIIGRIPPYDVIKMLQDIKDVEIGNNLEED